MRRFGLQTGIHFAHFGFESGVGVFERIYRFQFQMSTKEREICEFEINMESFLFKL